MSSFPIPVLLDCDPGHDDAFAIILACYSSSLNLLGITTSAGNQSILKTTTNALKVLHVSGITDIPVVQGRHEPLIREAIVAEAIHGESGLDGPKFPDLPVDTPLRQGKAVDFMYQSIVDYMKKHHPEATETHPISYTTQQSTYGHPNGVSLVCVGPMTNIAVLLLQYPEVKHLIKQIVLMGGSIGLGNITPSAEFNIYVDPEAAQIVFKSGLPVVMVPLEVTHTVRADEAVISALNTINSPFTHLLIDLLMFFAHTYKKVFDFDSPAIHDPTAVAYLIQPELFESSLMHVSVDVGPLCAGRTVCDVYSVIPNQRKNVRVCTKIDVAAFWKLMLGAVEQANKRSPMNETLH